MSNVSNVESILKNLTRTETWKRIAFMLLFIAAIYIVAVLMVVLILAQVLFQLVTGSDNAQLRRVCSELTVYMSQILSYLSYNSDRRPFPFAPFPQAGAEPQKAEPNDQSATSTFKKSDAPFQAGGAVTDKGMAKAKATPAPESQSTHLAPEQKAESETETETAAPVSASEEDKPATESVAEDEARYVDSAKAGFLGGFDAANISSPAVKAANIPKLSFAELAARAKARDAEERRAAEAQAAKGNDSDES